MFLDQKTATFFSEKKSKENGHWRLGKTHCTLHRLARQTTALTGQLFYSYNSKVERLIKQLGVLVSVSPLESSQ